MAPHLDGRQHQNRRQHRQQPGHRNHTEQQAAQPDPGERSQGHEGDETALRGDHREAPVATVAGKARHHGGQTYGEGQAAGEFEIQSEQQHQGGYEQFASRNTQNRRDHSDADTGQRTGQDQGDALQPGGRSGLHIMPPKQGRCDSHQQYCYYPVENPRLEPRRPTSADPGPAETSGQQREDDVPMRQYAGKGDGAGAERQGGCHYDEAHRLVQYDRLQRTETEQTDQQREPKLCSADADQPPQHTDRGTAPERGERRTDILGSGKHVLIAPGLRA
ncbi:hypothetical protein MCA1382 [Methylococcus capsulatus str. Bath]|uniref:Uncharacterized protein n=1 Tax=Methylococcus capsulatus (strain ATCC 33009 / NCIMB 11132 / Bath) TaxID=243233 RepID=Q608V7_METCA|nr:hypothetical protein MCA1382 [Methylococcus capsulatus str. Bath]